MSTNRLRKRSSLLQAVRAFFCSRGYIEVDTPIRLPVPLPESHIMPFSADGWFLQSSPEQCMKRLLAGGAGKLFQICHCFRKEEVGRYHQSEFTMLEWYRAGWSYLELMDECEEFLRSLVRAVPDLPGVRGNGTLLRRGRAIPLTSPWERLTVAEAFRRYADMEAGTALKEDRFDEVLVNQVEPRLGWNSPVFLCDYPATLGSLARKKENDPSVAERFELYVAGIELANGFSELTDPVEQRERFAAEMGNGEALETPYQALPEKFLADLELLGETAGIALGIDRLFMLLMGCQTISDVMSLSTADL